MSRTACGTIFPYDAMAKSSAPVSPNAASASRMRSGWIAGIPSACAAAFTGACRSFRPRPAGRSGCVTTRTQRVASANAWKLGTANSLVPKKTPRSSGRKGCRLRRRFFSQLGEALDRLRLSLDFHERGFLFVGHCRPNVLRFVRIKNTVEMVHLVLQTATEKSAAFDFVPLPMPIERHAHDPRVPC